jgi:hypothetical protein
MTEKTPEEKEPVARVLAIEWPEAGVAAFANHLLAVTDSKLSYLTFCQISPPAVVGTQEEQRRQLELMKSIKAQPVARVIVSIDTLRDMTKVLQMHLDQIECKHSNAASSDT